MKPWTTEEFDYLDSKWGEMPIPAIALHLGRSMNAVKIKAYRRGLGRHIHGGDFVTLNQLAIAINHGYWTVKNWEKYGLPVKMKKSVKCGYKTVNIDDFWKWAETHKPLIKFERIEPLILGKEPDWVNDARIIAARGRAKRSPWTQAEDDKLLLMLKQLRYTYSDIADELQRTEGAVKRRIHDLNIKFRPIKAEARDWTQEEIKMLMNLLEKGYSFEQIRKALRRTALAVRGEYERLTNPDMNRRKNASSIKYNGVSWREK